MTKKELAMYPVLKKRVEKLEHDIEDLKAKDIESVSGKVKGSMKEFPYIERRFSVQMEVPGEAEKIRRQIAKKQKEIIEVREQMRDVENFIDDIEDLHIKTIFEYSFLEGLTQKEVGDKIGLDRSRISRKVDNFLKNAHKAQK